MSRHDVMLEVPSDQHDVVNAYMVGLFGDDPGSDEITLNAYVDGQDPHTATYSFCVANCSQADTNSLTAFLLTIADCDSRVYPAGSANDYWALALSTWNLKPYVPSN